ncbi:hypothetical protein GR927_35985 [Mycolicibacterium sp. 3033]|nr:hypothetical protein [Mycolicibacterium aurantiacum]
MTNINDEAATTWRDLADALTAQQIAELEYWEAHPEIPPRADGSSPSPEDHAQALLFSARAYLSQNAAGTLFADVAPPPDEGVHYPWEYDGEGRWVRFFSGSDRKVDNTTVQINGMQYDDGTITRLVSIDGETEGLDATQCRAVAAALAEAANDLEQRG